MAAEAAASQYQVLEELGSGSFGVVYKAIERATGEIVAIKHIDLESSEDDIAEIQQEITVLSTCASPFVTQYRTSFLRGHKLWIVMEFLGGGSCLDLLKPGPFSEQHIAIVCRELLLGLDYLHQEGKIHRDIKAANILLSTTGKVKLADFGVAAQLTNIKSQRNTFVGTPFWMAPEVIQQNGYDFKADIWSLGITAMELIHGAPPHADIHPMKVLFLIPKQPAPRLEGNKYSKDFKDFVATCLIKDCDRRPSAKELLKHRFIRNAGKVEAMQELVERRQEFDSGRHRPSHPKLYQETLHTMRHVAEEADEWVFDTIRATPTTKRQPTIKRRKLSSMPVSSMVGAEDALQKMSLREAPLIASPSSTIRRQTVRKLPSVAELNVVNDKSPTKTRAPSVAIQPLNTMSRRESFKKPLMPDTSFGNGGSTVRLFRRVSNNSTKGVVDDSIIHADDTATIGTINSSGTVDSINPFISATGSIIVRSDRSPVTKPVPVPIITAPQSKEAQLGRRIQTKLLEPAISDLGLKAKSESPDAISQVLAAITHLTTTDPEGSINLLRSLIARAQADPKLSDALGLTHPIKSSAEQKVPATPKTPRRTGTDVTLGTPKTPRNTVISPTKPLVMAQNNPHLRSLRHRQSLQTLGSGGSIALSSSPEKPKDDRSILKEEQVAPGSKEKRDAILAGSGNPAARNLPEWCEKADWPGQEVLGMEHCKQLGDVLYGRWIEGLSKRWGGNT